jgi:glyoxylase-like metal-dependent hydrolase (beta-lactamase superfamily II)
VLPGAAPTLVGTGPATAEASAVLQVRAREVLLSLDSIARIVLPQVGIAHAGLCGELQALTGAPVFAHPLAAGFLADFDAAWEARSELHLRAARAAAVPSALIQALASELSERAALGRSVPAGALHPLDDRSNLRMGDGWWSVAHLAGPSPDEIGFHHAPSGTFLGGDLLARHAPTRPALVPRRDDGSRPQTLADLIRSWRRFGGLSIDIAWMARGPAIRAHRVLVARRLAELRRRLQVARGAVAGGAGTIWETACVLDASPPRVETLDALLGDTVALLDWLVERGLVHRSVQDGVVRLRAR